MMNGKHKKKSEKKIKKGSNREGVLRPSIYIKNKNLIQKRIPQVARAVNKSSNRSTFDNSRASRTRKQTRGIINWMHIANCVQHEMYPKLASALRSIINTQQKFNFYDLTEYSAQQMINQLKTQRNVPIEERQYLNALVKRAERFTTFAIESDEKKQPSKTVATQRSKNDTVKSALQHDKSSGDLDMDLLQDIFDVHRGFVFTNYHFKCYSENEYKSEIRKVANKGLHSQFIENHVLNSKFEERLNFHPSYVVNDDIFEVFNYIFNVSCYISYLRNNIHNIHFQVECIVIPESVEWIYDENMKLIFTIDSIDQYLYQQKIYDYTRNMIRSRHQIVQELRNQFNASDLLEDKITKLMILIDRRHLNMKKK
eukprot:539092_1